MKIKIISIMVIMLFLSGSLNALGISLSKDNDHVEETALDKTIIQGYRADKFELIGTVGDFSDKLAGNNDLGIEIMDKRTPTDRFFKNEDGSITAFLSIIPTCYRDENGVWHDGELSDNIRFTTLDNNFAKNSNCYGYVYFVDGEVWPSTDVNYMGCKVFSSVSDIILVGQHYDEYFGGYWKKYSRGFAQWSISGIPGSATIDNVKLSFWSTNEKDTLYHEKEDGDIDHRQYADLEIWSMGFGSNGVKPSDYETSSTNDGADWDSLEKLMDDCGLGFSYKGPTRVRRNDPGKKTWNLDACDKFEDCLSDGDDWFAVGFKDDNENKCGTKNDAGGIILEGDDNKLLLEVTYTVPSGNVALFISGGNGDQLQRAFDNSADKYGAQIFETNLGYGSNRVKYLRQPSIDQIKTELSDLADEMSSNNDVLIYLCNHGLGNPYKEDSWWKDHFPGGTEGQFLLNRNRQLLDWGDLANILDVFHGLTKSDGRTGYGTGIIVVEACFSGHFITEISNLHRDADGEPHIIITATGHDTVSWGYIGPDPHSIFSKKFFNELKDGDTSYGDAWEITDNYIYTWVNKELTKAKDADFVNNLFKMINKNFANNFLSCFLSNIKKIMERYSDNLPKPQFYPYEDWKTLLRTNKELGIQSPLLCDNGIGNYAGTASVNRIDTLPDNGNGNLASSTKP
jgi:hypothetical protein